MECLLCNKEHPADQACSNNATSGWQWKNKAPGPQSVTAGNSWAFCLPLIGQGPMPACKWQDIPADLNATFEGFTIRLKIPLNKKGIYKLVYKIEGYSHLDGVLRLKILPGLEKKKPLVKTSDTPSIVLPATPSPSSEQISNTVPLPQTEPKDRLGSEALASPKTDRATKPTESSPLPPLFIHVFCDSTPIPQLKTKLEVHKSLLLGKRSDSKKIFPDINLKNYFISSSHEATCSREQAKIYISDNCVFIQNLGKQPLLPNNGKPIISEDIYNWSIGEYMQLPGGIRLLLAL